MADSGTRITGAETAYEGQVKATPQDPDAELEALYASPYTHDWCKQVIFEGMKRDSVDAVVGLEVLAGAFRRRMEAAFAAHMEASLDSEAVEQERADFLENEAR